MCHDDRRRQLVALAKSGKPTTFITLTSNPATGPSPASRARALASAWPVVVKRIKAKYGYPHIPYFCVFEATKRGEPHLHILLRVKWIDQKWLSMQMRELTNAPVVDIRQVQSPNEIANYIGKYVGKAPHRFATCKRYWRTRSWVTETHEREPDDTIWSDRWNVSKRFLWEHERRWRALGWDVAKEGHMIVAMARDPPEPVQGYVWNG